MASRRGPHAKRLPILSARSNHLVKWSILDCSITLVQHIFIYYLTIDYLLFGIYNKLKGQKYKKVCDL